ncbi:hypothetical protein [Mesorhizobium onobrychidis]|uniref:Uncharacterized protein n=1 Tax=Mesorhizobium onobrychidis TaxID=2775404 RepID=A0ABY5R021_9HYPH|nr:hypothetical protein [Mesorhizobium onobrychidis]UVC16825.1 hypothetical protein IHQ72_06625 [Mesorhizobium onobrychidis]
MPTYAAEHTTPHPTTLDDLPPLKLAIQRHLVIEASPIVWIAQARIGESGTIYLCGLTDGGIFSSAVLFFAENRNGTMQIMALDKNPKVDDIAKTLCDMHGFRTPIPG